MSTDSQSSFLANERGNVFMIFALVALPLFALIGISLDLSRANNTKQHIQEAMDAAILWAASEMSNGGIKFRKYLDDGADFEERAQQVFLDNLRTRGVTDAVCSGARVDAQPALRRVSGTADCRVPLTLASVIASDDLKVEAKASAVYGGDTIEIALMLDVSGSMRGQRLTDLKAASRTLIDTLIPVTHVGDVRISIVPYSTAVNAGSYGDVVTGITDLFAHTIANLGADPNKLVAAAQDGSGEAFELIDAVGNSGLANLPPEFFACAKTVDPEPIRHRSPYVCEIRGDDGVGADDCIRWSRRGRDLYHLPESMFPVRTSTHINFFYNDDDDGGPDCEDGCRYALTRDIIDYTYEQIHGGSVPANCVDGSGTATETATDWRKLDWSAASLAYADYDFSVLGATHQANLGALNCVTERTDEMFSDASPITYPMGAKASTCPAAPVEPLTHNKTILHNAIDSLHADGWTAGHLGIAWTWYTLSPDWSPVWPFNRRTQSGGTQTVKRYAVLMTDGAFNTYYENAGGDSSAKAQTLCTAMKADGITIFAVAFNAPSSAKAVLKNCASSAGKYFEASSGAELLAAYDEIAASVSNVRLSE